MYCIHEQIPSTCTICTPPKRSTFVVNRENQRRLGYDAVQMARSGDAHGTPFSDDEEIAVFSLYSRVGHVSQHHLSVIKLASTLCRTPDAISLRLGNYESVMSSGEGGLENAADSIFRTVSEYGNDTAFLHELAEALYAGAAV